MLYEAEPGLFKQVLGDVGPIRQPGEEVVQPAIECVMNGIKRPGFAHSQAANELQFTLPVHQGHNAERVET